MTLARIVARRRIEFGHKLGKCAARTLAALM